MNTTLTTLQWEDDGQGLIRGFIGNPKITLFIIERNPQKPYRGRMTGAIIPDDEEAPDGLLGNALISWLQPQAAIYLREFQEKMDLGRLADVRKYATEVQQLGEVLIGPGCVAPFHEILQAAKDIKEWQRQADLPGSPEAEVKALVDQLVKSHGAAPVRAAIAPLFDAAVAQEA